MTFAACLMVELFTLYDISGMSDVLNHLIIHQSDIFNYLIIHLSDVSSC